MGSRLARICELALHRAQVKDGSGSHVVIWTECKRTHNQYELVVDFGPIHGNSYTLAETLASLV